MLLSLARPVLTIMSGQLLFSLKSLYQNENQLSRSLNRSASPTRSDTHMRADIALKTVLIHFVMLECLRSMEVAIAMTTAESLDVAVRQ